MKVAKERPLQKQRLHGPLLQQSENERHDSREPCADPTTLAAFLTKVGATGNGCTVTPQVQPFTRGRGMWRCTCVYTTLSTNTHADVRPRKRLRDATRKIANKISLCKPLSDVGFACMCDSGFYLCTAVSPPNTVNQRSCSRHGIERTASRLLPNSVAPLS